MEENAPSLLTSEEYQKLMSDLHSPFAFRAAPLPDDTLPNSDRVDGSRRQISTESVNARGKIKSDPFLNRYISYVDTYEARLLKDAEDVEERVRSYLNTEILDKLNRSQSGNISSNLMLNFELMPAGSFYEGVKVKHANEFDYLLVPFIEDTASKRRIEIGSKLTMTRNSLPTIKNIRDRPVQHLSYFSLGTNDHEVERALRSLTGASTGGNGKISARNVTEGLRAMVCEALGCGNSNSVTTKGPAVTLYLSCPGTQENGLYLRCLGREIGRAGIQYPVKVDLTLALKVEVPLQYFDEGDNKTKIVELNELTARRRHDLTKQIRHCFFVTAGDFWQCSFSYHQTYIIRETAEENQSGLRAIKSLRDDLSLSDPLDNTILSTYPLKVAYLNKTFNMDDEDVERQGKETKWNAAEIDKHVVDMLQSIDEQGAERSMKDIFIKNNAVFHDADKSYLESRRLLRHLKTEKKLYKLHGRGHCCCLSIIIVLLILVAITALTFNEAINYKTLPKEICITASISSGSVIVGLLCLLMGIVCFALTSCSFVLFNRCCVKRQSKLYQLSFCCLLFLYICALIFALIVFGIVLTILILFYFARMDACQVVSDMEDYFHVAAGISFAGVGLVFLYISIFYICLRYCGRHCMWGTHSWPRWDLCSSFRGTCVGVCCQKSYHNDVFAWFMCDDIFCRICCRRMYEEGFIRGPLRASVFDRATARFQKTVGLSGAVEERVAVTYERETGGALQTVDQSEASVSEQTRHPGESGEASFSQISLVEEVSRSEVTIDDSQDPGTDRDDQQEVSDVEQEPDEQLQDPSVEAEESPGSQVTDAD
ncbi:uncharacterized protein LOC106179482 [Lingula anatina]|uniref:Uncharacterized protein LOC106179482 n=1 Tax=Lingula anatina TaxID=7574 RepID=A0A1S3K7I1_LINAN|nr:uncharacterized protein LOC106179482 [Lingula anatina]XP_013418580.1 uncharacterized protein LOC106179482 [Lingula anatina]|eukprot:XP_013418578.1 uncharacterized protein LOC106179482 [Lingula anatina]